MADRFVFVVLALAACGGGDDAGALPDAPIGSGGADAPLIDAPPGAMQVFDGTLDDNILQPQITPGGGLLTPTEGYAPLGTTGNKFGDLFLRSATGNTVTLTVTGLPAHSKINIGFLFAAIDSLDGTGTFPAGDYMRIDLDGAVIFRESFANALSDQIQSYEPAPGVELARHVDLGFGGPGGFYTDSAYDMSQEPRFQNLAHSASTATISFTLEGEGVQTLDDESWAVDNLRITVIP